MLLLWVTSMMMRIRHHPFLPTESAFTTRRPSSHTRHGCIRVSPLCNIPTAASRRSLDRVSVPVWLVIPLRPARDRRLGEPLPHQLANPTWVHPIAVGPKVPTFPLRAYAVLAAVSSWYPLDWAAPHALLTRPPLVTPESKLSCATVRLACVRPAASVQSEP